MVLRSNSNVACIGTGSSTIVAIHGIQGTGASWHPLANVMSSEVQWVLPNLQGRGAAWRGTTASDYSLESFAMEVIRVIKRHVPTQNYVLAGWSMGVSVALATVVQMQRMGGPLPQGLVLMSGSPVLQQTSWFHARDQTALLKEIELRERRLALHEAADHHAVCLTWQAIRNSDQRSLLPLVTQPTLVIHGSEDQDAPLSHAQMLEHQLPRARLHVIQEAGHGILVQNTACVAQHLRTFLSEFPNFKS